MKQPVIRKQAAPLPQLERRQLPSVWPYAGVLMLAIVCAVALLGWSAHREQVQQQRAAWTEQAQRDARLAALQLQRRLEGAAAALRVLSREEGLLQALQTADAQALARLQDDYRARLPDVARVALLPAGLSTPDMQAQPPIGYAVLDMLRQAERQQAAPAPEVHLPGLVGAHVNLVQPVLDGQGAVLGHVLATYPLSWLQQALGGVDGGVILQQAGVTLFQKGPAQGVQVRVAVPGTAWQLAYTAPIDTPARLSTVMLLSLALLGALLLVIAAAFHLLQRELARRSLATLQALDVAPSRRPAARPVPARVRPASGKAVESKPKQQKPAQAQARQPEPARPASERIAVNPRILRAYDVRGVVGQGLDAKVVYGFGRAIASLAAEAGQQQIVVARDGRLTSPELQQALIEGLVAGGRHVIDIGQTPTPMMHFATFHLGTSAGVMVTGSHNPPEYNGLKIVIDGRTLAGDEIKALGRRVEQGDFVSGEGTVRTESVLEAYVERICDDVTVHRPLRIVVDCGNGVAGAVAPQVYRALGCEVEELFCEVDGNFPHHHPDPTVPSNLDALISLVRLQGADLGLAFDGDGDRLGVVDNRGRILWPDRQLMLFSRDVLTRAPGGHVVFDVKCTARLPEFIIDHAGVPVMWKSGHSMIRNKMRELQASLGGDMSGHIFFADRWYGFDDAIYAGARLLEILSMDARSSAEQFDELPNALGTAEIRIRLADGEAERIMQQLGSELGATLSGARVTTIDGLRVDLADGWALVRSSNTEPCLVLRFEGDDQDALARIQEAFRSRLLEIKPDLELPF